MLARQYGLACDRIVNLTMVDANGTLVQASKAQNPDLLWASCGGGGPPRGRQQLHPAIKLGAWAGE